MAGDRQRPDRQPGLLSERSVEAIAAIAPSADDIQTILESVGIPFVRYQASVGSGIVYIPSPRDHATASIQALDLDNPECVARILRVVPQFAELYRMSRKFDGQRLVRLRMALDADGFHVSDSSDPVTAFGVLANSASTALSDISGIRAEIRRLEKAMPDDPSAAIGRAKNLVESTAKAVLDYRAHKVDGELSLPALAAKAMQELGVHPKEASSERELARRLLARLQGIVQDLAELRNEVGDGHGAVTTPQALETRHARLAVWSALGWCSFMLDTLSGSSVVAGTNRLGEI